MASVNSNYPLDDTTLTLRTMIDCRINGKLQFQGIFADGIATPESTVAYALDDTSKGYAGTAAAGHTKKYPDTESFESAFSSTTTRYRDKLSNWQTAYPFTNPDLNKLYKMEAAAVKGGVTGAAKASDTFLIYQVKQYDTLPKIAAYYGIPLSQLLYDNRVQNMLVVENNTLFIRNPQKNADKPYNPPALTDSAKAQLDAQLMGRGLHCEFGFEPVNLNTGNFYLNSVDATIPDYSETFDIDRTYNSKGAAYISSFGRGWQFSYGEALSKAEDGTILYTRADGSVLRFTGNGNQTYTCPEGYDLELTTAEVRKNTYDFGNGEETYPVYEYEIRDTDQLVKRFDCYGMLLSVTDEAGNKTTLAYDGNYQLKSITSAAGNTYGFTVTADNKVETITLPNGGVLTYEYDQENNLTAYTDACGGKIVYEYDQEHRMTAWYDAKGSKVISNTYDAEGRVTKQTDANGHDALFAYAAGQTTTTDGSGNQTIYQYDDQFRTTSITYADGTSDQYVYKNNRLVSETDAVGNTTAYTYDDNGNVLSETRFDGAERKFTYNSTNKCLSETDYGSAYVLGSSCGLVSCEDQRRPSG